MAWQYQSAVVVDDALGPPPPGGVSSDDKNAWIDVVGADELAQAKLLDSSCRASISKFQQVWRARASLPLDQGHSSMHFVAEPNRHAPTPLCIHLKSPSADTDVGWAPI